MRPKVFGAWNLHNTLLNNGLDFFVSIASVSGILGGQGQSAYCATTTFLEAFSAYRASLGLAANTIDLGPVMEVGSLAKQSVQMQNQAKDVMGCEVSEQELLAIMDVAMSGKMNKESHYCSIAGLQCTGSSTQTYWSQNPMFAHMRVKTVFGQREKAGGAVDKESNRRLLTAAASLAEARKVIYDALAIKMSTILMIADEDLSPNKAFASYGSDSLVAVEIRSWIRREMEATVILMEILADNTLTSLTESILRKSALCKRLHEEVDLS